jgi:hypothetical protein
MVVLLNILVALYNSAYEDITDNAIDEYMALFATKTMQFVRAPDENVFIARMFLLPTLSSNITADKAIAFNLIEVFLLIMPLEWWLSTKTYARLNDYIMAFIYSPLLLITAALETRAAHRVRSNARRGAEDDDVIEEWEQLECTCDFEADGWAKKVEATRPNVEMDAATKEVIALRGEVKELKMLVEALVKGMGKDVKKIESENGVDGTDGK